MDGNQKTFSWLHEIRGRAIVRHREKILLTGATGYSGGRLLRNLESDSYPVRCLLRRPEVLSPHAATTEVVRGDLLKPETLPAAMRGVTAAYYLVHSMGSGGNYAEERGQDCPLSQCSVPEPDARIPAKGGSAC